VTADGLARWRLALIATAFFFSSSGAGIKAVDLSAWQVTGGRSAVAALTLWLLLPGSRRGWNGRVLLVGLSYAATLLTFVAANKLTTAANTVFLQATAPLYILLLSPWWLGERLRPSDVPFVLVMAAGLSCFFLGYESPQHTAPDPRAGNLLAVGSGVAWAATVMGLRWLGKGTSGSDRAAAAAVCGNVIAVMICLPLFGGVAGTAPADWAVVAALGVFQLGGAYVLLTRAIPHVPALEAGLLLLVEPPLNATWAWLVHREAPSAWALVGGMVILGASAARTVLSRGSPGRRVGGGR
jgi:drug/metabolite transporter (DMT)-like permease